MSYFCGWERPLTHWHQPNYSTRKRQGMAHPWDVGTLDYGGVQTGVQPASGRLADWMDTLSLINRLDNKYRVREL